MATPRLQLRRGTTAPSGSIAVVAEPFFDTSGQNFYIATATNAFSLVGGASFTSRVSEFLTASVAGASVGSVTIKDAQATQNAVTIDVPSTVTSSYSFTLPANAGTSGYVLQTDGSGNTSWVAQTAGYAGFNISDGTTTQSVESGNTVTFVDGSGINAVVSATDNVTISLDINSLTAESAIADTDTFAFYDVSATTNRKATADNIRDYVLGGVSGDITINASGVATIAANSVALGTDTTGQYAISITAGDGISSTTPNAGDGTSYTVAVDPDTGIAVSGTGVAIKNAGALTNGTLSKWDSTNGQFVNSIFSDNGTNGTVGGGLTIGAVGLTVNGATSGSSKIVSAATASGTSTLPTGTGTLALTSAANGTITLGTDTAGNYVGAVAVTANTGLGITFTAGEGATATLAGVDATTSVKGVASFSSSFFSVTSGAVSLANSSSGAVLAISGTANEVEVSRTNGTVTVGLPNSVTITNDLTIGGNLTVQGTTVTVESSTVRIKDSVTEQGLQDNGTTLVAPTTANDFDAGHIFHYFRTGDQARTSAIFWDTSTQRMVFAENATETNNVFTVTAGNFATLEAEGLTITDTAGTAETVIVYNGTNSRRELQNIYIDCGTY